VTRTLRLTAIAALVVAASASAQRPTKPEAKSDPAASLELDLTSTAEVSSVGVLPPVVRVAAGGGFVGFDAKKITERFDLAGHKRLVSAFSAQLSGKVLPADAMMGFLGHESILASQLKTAAVLSKIAKGTKVEWLVGFEFNKSGALVGTIYDGEGKVVGEPSAVANATSVNQKRADELAALVTAKIIDLAKQQKAEEAAKLAAVAPPPVLPPPEDDVPDAELHPMVTQRAGWKPDPSRTRAAVTVGPGAVTRSLELSGDGAAALAELRNNGVVGIGVYAQLTPLQLFEPTANKAWSDLELEVHYRRAFVTAQGVGGGVEGQTCTMTDDDLQLRGTFRWKLGQAGSMLPSIGVGGGWSQEQTLFSCSLPLVSATYRGADVQLRVRQPLYRDILSIDLAVGPRFVLPGPLASKPGFSLAGEAWLEARPYSVLFARGGARLSRLQVANDTLAVVDTRAFFALELGAYF
jgi:hypothetical protein